MSSKPNTEKERHKDPVCNITERYAAVVEHESKETFMAMHLSDERQMLFKKVETLIEGMPEPHFYEVAASCLN
jgi:hypothetical protein